MVFQSTSLLNELSQIINAQTIQVMQLLTLTDEELNKRKQLTSWSVLECIEHLNLYSAYYINEIENSIAFSKYSATEEFTSGWLGNYFANSMLPTSKSKPMKTFKDKNPLHKPLNKNVLNIFLENQERYTTILQDAQKVSLKKTRIKISIATWIRISLGDTLRFIINHQVRHLEQADKVLKK